MKTTLLILVNLSTIILGIAFLYSELKGYGKRLKFTRISTNYKLPTRGTEHSAGHDFYLPCDALIDNGTQVIIDTGIKATIPENHVLLLFPRSSIGIKNNLMLSNSTGVIDSDYKDTIKIALYNYGTSPILLRKGERIMQGVCVSYITTKDKPLNKTRNGGIGSTGR